MGFDTTVHRGQTAHSSANLNALPHSCDEPRSQPLHRGIPLRHISWGLQLSCPILLWTTGESEGSVEYLENRQPISA